MTSTSPNVIYNLPPPLINFFDLKRQTSKCQKKNTQKHTKQVICSPCLLTVLLRGLLFHRCIQGTSLSKCNLCMANVLQQGCNLRFSQVLLSDLILNPSLHEHSCFFPTLLQTCSHTLMSLRSQGCTRK